MSKYFRVKLPALISWFGGKYYIKDWIIDHFPSTPYKIYVEPFGGAAHVLLRKSPSPIEVYNDLDDGLVDLFRVLKDKNLFNELGRRLYWTLHSRSDYLRAVNILKYKSFKDIVERAWAVFVAQNYGFSGMHYLTKASWGCILKPSSSLPSLRIVSKLNHLHLYNERLNSSELHIENMDGIDCIDKWDSEQTFFYLDPPYVMGTRKESSRNYIYEPDNSYHEKLIDKILNVKGKVLLSGYDNELYRKLLDYGWNFDYRDAICFSSVSSINQKVNKMKVSGKKDHEIQLSIPEYSHFKRQECVWANYSFNQTPNNWNDSFSDSILF